MIVSRIAMKKSRQGGTLSKLDQASQPRRAILRNERTQEKFEFLWVKNSLIIF